MRSKLQRPYCSTRFLLLPQERAIRRPWTVELAVYEKHPKNQQLLTARTMLRQRFRRLPPGRVSPEGAPIEEWVLVDGNQVTKNVLVGGDQVTGGRNMWVAEFAGEEQPLVESVTTLFVVCRPYAPFRPPKLGSHRHHMAKFIE